MKQNVISDDAVATALAERTEKVQNLRTSGMMGFRDDHGNAGLGLVARFGTCSACGRRNKIVGPIEAEPDKRTCFGSCEDQKGSTVWDTKMARMGWGR